MRKRWRGFTLSEVMVSAFILSFLLLMIFAVYRMGAQSWMAGDANSELLGRVQGLAGKIGRQVEGSTFSSLSVAASDLDPDLRGCAFLSAVDDAGMFHYDPGQSLPEWSHAQVYYFSSSAQQVYQRRLPIVGANRRDRVRDYFDRFGREPRPSYRNPLPDHYHDGKVIANDIKDVAFQRYTEPIVLSSGSGTLRDLDQLKVSITVEKAAYGKQQPIQLISEHYFYFRN